jgi:hypothetical protein
MEFTDGLVTHETQYFAAPAAHSWPSTPVPGVDSRMARGPGVVTDSR